MAQSTTTKVSKDNNFIDFLKMFHCGSPAFPNDFGSVIRVTDTQTVAETFKKMCDHRIMSIPVINHITGKPEYVVSMLNVVDYFLQLFKSEDFEQDVWTKITNLIHDKTSRLHSDTILKIPEITDTTLDPVHTIHESATVWDAVLQMAEKNTHRVLVVNDRGEMVNLITQSRVMQYMGIDVDKLPNAQKTVAELSLGTKNPLTINENETTAYSAFRTMKDFNMVALPVVNDAGKLVGNISANDLKLVGYDGKFWNLLGKTVKDYLKELRANPQTHIQSHVFAMLQEENSPPIVVKCKESQKFAFVIRIVNFYRVHRIYVVDDEGKPVRVISLSDILKQVISN